MSKRRKARECALQILYQLDLKGGEFDPKSIYQASSGFWESFSELQSVQQFTEQLLQGIAEHKSSVDANLRACSKKWRLNRMSPVDRNILRIGAYEIFYSDTPIPVVINEAVELAKKFGARQSAAFVNGMLDEVKKLKQSNS